MTAVEFREEITTWWELKEFCSDVGCDIGDEICSNLDEEVDYDIGEYARDYTWQELRDLLSDITDGYGYFKRNGAFDYEGLDESDFDSYKDDVYDWAERNGYFDDEEDEDEPDDEPVASDDEVEDDEPQLEDEEFSIGDLIGMCSVTFVTIKNDIAHQNKCDEDALNAMLNINIPKPIVK